ncbi:MAG: MSMEG_6728 family protein [Mycobacteriales bacterium]
MQTFLPYPDLRASCVVLDDRRLGKQRVETFQILRALTWPSYAWKNHPAVRMWRGFVPGLVEYGLANCREWTRRGYADTVAAQLLAWTGGAEPVGAPLPPWFGLEALHLSHRSSLLRKDPAHYRPIFGGEPDDLPYLWPPSVFPRWPVRTGGAGVPVDQAVQLLGFEAPRPGQAEAATAAAHGLDVLLVARPGSGGSSGALLAGLATPGRTLWVSPPWGPPAGPVPDVPLPPPRVRQAGGARPATRAQPPGEQDLAAMRAEAAEPDFVFAAPSGLAPVERLGLVVVDRADELSAREAAAITAVRDGCPMLLVVPRADAGQRAVLRDRFGLRSPAQVTVS